MSEQIIFKICTKCKQTKSISEFYKDRNSPNGLFYWCKSCIKNYRKSEKGKNVQKHYYQSEKGKIERKRCYIRHREQIKDRVKKYHQTQKGKIARHKAGYYYSINHPERSKAHHAINHAIRAGKLSPASIHLCYYCPKPAQQYHHYHGYEPEHWFDVVPVCKKCHNKINKNYRPNLILQNSVH